MLSDIYIKQRLNSKKLTPGLKPLKLEVKIENDYRKIEFCREMMNKHKNNYNFLARIVSSARLPFFIATMNI